MLFFVLFSQNVLITLTLTFYYSSNTHSAQRLIVIEVIRHFFDYCFMFFSTFDGRAKPLDAELVYNKTIVARILLVDLIKREEVLLFLVLFV